MVLKNVHLHITSPNNTFNKNMREMSEAFVFNTYLERVREWRALAVIRFPKQNAKQTATLNRLNK